MSFEKTRSDGEASTPDDFGERRKSLTTNEKGDTQIATGYGEVITIDKKAENRLVWKLDFHILPFVALMYLFNSLDKSNLGNAKTNGLEADLGMAGTDDYNIVLSVFFVPYVLTAPFLAILGKKFGPSRVLPCMMFAFGVLTIAIIGVHNFGGLFAVRWFLGMSESAFFPLVIYYLTLFYRRGELARRLAIFYAAQSIASAFGGLLAYGCFQINSGPYADQNWRYLFLIEGTLTCAVSLLAFVMLPFSSSKARFLSDEQKKLALYRMQVDSSAEVDNPFVFRDAIKIMKHPTSWVILGIEMCLGIPLQSVTLFLPQIVGRLNYGPVLTNLYTVAPNVTGAIMLLILAFASDLTRWRFPFIALGFLFTFIGFIIYASIDVVHDKHVAYFACFVMTWGTSAPSVLLDCWYNNNIADEGRRVLLTSIGVPVANLMGVVSSNIFLPKDAPDYIPALAVTAAFGGMGIVLTLLLGVWMMIDNKRRDTKLGRKLNVREVPTELLKDGPASPDFRWFY